MDRKTLVSLAVGVMVAIASCNGNAWDELPSSIASFVSEYFPFGEVAGYSESENHAVVKIRNGATLTFSSTYEWVDVNGNGSVLPQNFLFDKLPPILYDYIEATQNVGEVYRVGRSAGVITVDLYDTSVVFDEATGTIIYPSARAIIV